MRSDFYIYVYFRLDGSPCYVGKGSGKRWKAHEHRSCNPHLAAIIAKSGRELPKVKIRENLIESQAFEIERALIAAIGRKANGGPLVNMTDGGDGSSGRILSEEERVKRKQIFNQPHVRARMSASHIGLPSHRRGIVVTDETRKRLRESHLGKKQSSETIAKRVTKNKGKKRTAEFCAENSMRVKALRAAQRAAYPSQI